MKKPAQNIVIKPMPGAWLKDPWHADFPNLYAFLSDTKWEDGTPRQPGSLSIFTQLGVLKGCLSDKALSRVTFVEAPSWDELIMKADMAVCADDTVWRGQEKRIPY